MKTLAIAAALMLSAATALPAFAEHDDADQHAADHREHRATHHAINDAHEQAHEEGYSSPRPTVVITCASGMFTTISTKIIPSRVMITAIDWPMQ